MKRITVVVLPLALALPACTRSPGDPSPPPGGAVSARVTLTHAKNEYFLGENIIVEYRVGPGPLRCGFGVYYPKQRRYEAYVVEAVPVDETGKAVGVSAEPSFEKPTNHIGMIGAFDVKPGESHAQTLYLPRYVRLDKPGRYSIRIANIDPLNPQMEYSSGATTITLKEPSPAKARAIYERMKKLSREPVSGIDEIADFEALVAPVYLPVLREHAILGDRDSLDALGAMRTAGSNAALIEAIGRALDKDELDVALATYRHVRGLPDPRLYPGFYRGPSAEDPEAVAGRALVARVWRPEFADPVRRLAARLVRSPKPIGLEEAWRIYGAVGKPDDLPDVMLGYTKAIEFQSLCAPSGYSFAVRILLKRGAKVPAHPQTPGEIGAYLVALRHKSDFRPAGLADNLALWLDRKTWYIREEVLALAAKPVASIMLERLPELLASDNKDLQFAACRLAIWHPREGLRDPLLKILRTRREGKPEDVLDEYLLDAATDAARANGVTADQLAEIWLSRIDDSDLGIKGFHRLVLAVIDNDASDGRAVDLPPKVEGVVAQRWKRFLDEHRKELRKGRRFKLGDPEITPDLFPPGFHFRLHDRPWPPYE